MAQEKKKILIIDDDYRNIFALSAVLKSRGFIPLSTIDAREGTAMLLKDKSIQAVLMDVMMPEMDGYEAIAHIRKHPEIARIPIIAVTARAMVGDRERCLEAGADDYISKPVDVDKLVKMLEGMGIRY